MRGLLDVACFHLDLVTHVSCLDRLLPHEASWTRLHMLICSFRADSSDRRGTYSIYDKCVVMWETAAGHDFRGTTAVGIKNEHEIEIYGWASTVISSTLECPAPPCRLTRMGMERMFERHDEDAADCYHMNRLC